jgi:hypothetical protein
VDEDIIYALASRLNALFRRTTPVLYTRWVEQALLRRARLAVDLAEAADDAEDRLQETVWRTGRAGVVHWAVGPTSDAGVYEARGFPACGCQATGVSMTDPSWQRGTEQNHPVTCEHCRALLDTARAAE